MSTTYAIENLPWAPRDFRTARRGRGANLRLDNPA
jgi:hypothetical protein